MFRAAKDALSSRAAQSYVNTLIARYGEVRDLKIDSENKTVEGSCLLRGETVPIRVSANYVIETKGGKNFVRLKNCSSNKPWLENLVADYGQERSIEVPAWASSIV
ncbi:hypothetical protein [Oleiharenicola lentus]|uniref:hypothetical protein n=1 Tax=Oleiharenicola lentus TaxID=2508720 RepID=UPI003F663F41